MKNRINAIEGAPHCLRVSHITDGEFDPWIQIIWSHGVGAVHLRREAIESAHTIVMFDQFIREV
jgi:hypothetical protein